MTLLAVDDTNADQIAYWNGPVGLRWLARQEMQDRLLAPIMDPLLERASAGAGEVVLDIGCGCGATSIDLARRVVPGGSVLGVDISSPMLERARERAAPDLPVDFILADATAYQFEPGGADLLFSRFGVMFFAEPVKSFANMRRGLRKEGRLVVACWRGPRENPWLLMPLQEAYKHVPRLPDTSPEDPGPFAFADEGRVRRILEGSGFDAIALEPVKLSIDLAVGRGLDGAVETALGIGPTSRALEGQPPELQAAAADSIRTALARHQVGNAVPLAAAIWIVTARNR